MLKEKIREADEAKSLRQCKWRNVYFTKAGKAHRGNIAYDTKPQAEEKGAEVAAQAKGLIPNTAERYKGWQFQTLDGSFTHDEYAWHMQMPVMEGQ